MSGGPEISDREQALRAGFSAARRVVVKLGSALLTNPVTGLERARISALGAVAEGCVRLGLRERPASLAGLQAAAAVGQVGLMAVYEQLFQSRHRHAAMVLLTHDDFAHRERYLNARSTLHRLLELGVTPVINENDTVATDEIRFGDNDTLGGLVATLIEADVLVLLTDADGLFESDPRVRVDAPLVHFAGAHDRSLDAMAGPGGPFSRGGMVTKLAGARLAADSGAHTLIAPGRMPAVITRLLAGERIGTLLAAEVAPRDARKRWIAGQQRARGCVVLDAGAVQAVVQGGGSVLCVGVRRVEGHFQRGEVVRMEDESGQGIGQGIINYSSTEAMRLAGVPTKDMLARLGYVNEPELIHRDNLALYR